MVLQDGDGTRGIHGSESGVPMDGDALPQGDGDPRTLYSAALDPGSPFEVIGATYARDGVLLELWPQALEAPQRYVLPSYRLAGGMGDYDGDGVTDLVVGDDYVIDYVRASPDPALTCTSSAFHSLTISTMAVGDLDGDLRADVVIANDRGLTLLATQ